MTADHVYEMLAEVFIAEQVSQCFALLGDANMNWAAAMQQRGCNFTFVRDEHCAVSAAMAWSRSTGQIGVATVTCGPGLTQIMTALPAAVRAQIPLVIFAGEAPLHKAWYNQAIEQAPLVNACGAEYQSLHSVELMPTQIRDAFVHAQLNLRPVVLGVPFDLQHQTVAAHVQPVVASRHLIPVTSPTPPAADEVARAAVTIDQASSIVIMAGLGAKRSGAANACRQLAIQTDALLATTLPARGLFHNDPWSIGVIGGFASQLARELVAKADLIIAVGTRLASHNSDAGKLFNAARVLHIDTRPLAISQGRNAASMHIRGDARLSVEALIAQTSRNTPNQLRTRALAERLANSPPDDTPFNIEEGLLDPRQVAKSLDEAIPKHWDTVNSSGHCSYFFAHMKNRPAERFLTIREFGAIGNGLAYAIGVALARPDNPVVLFDGDGSFLMHTQELETIRRHRLKLLICVCNDGGYGSEIHKLRAEGLATQGAVFGHDDLAAIARGFGIDGVRIVTTDQINDQLQRFMANDTAAVWDFHVSDRVVSPVLRQPNAKRTGANR